MDTGVATLRLDRPEVRNAIDVNTLNALRAAAAKLDRDDRVDIVVLTGAGDIFSAGGDVHDMVSRRGKSLATFERHMEGLADLVGSIQASSKVWLARVNGDAVGAGLGLVLSCDLAVASATARFAALFGSVGLVADTGVSAMLVRTVGIQRAKEMLLTGRFLDAETAEDWGLVHRVAAPSAMDAAMDETIAALRSIPPVTRGLLKRQLARNAHVPLRDALVAEALLQGVAFATPEHAERSDAFLKRKGGGKHEG